MVESETESDTRSVSDLETVLRVERLGHSYAARSSSLNAATKEGNSAGKRRVLDGISFAARVGELVAVQGASGCGKTTLLLACGAMQRPTTGNVFLSGTNLFAASPAERSQFRATKIGYLFQTLELVPYLNVLDNLRIVRGVTDSAARDWLSRLGLEDRLTDKPRGLSHGQRQRVALARALVHGPALVIADEPTGNLDPDNSRLVFRTLRKFADEGGCVLIATHDCEVESFADRMFVIESAAMVETRVPSRGVQA